MQTDNNREAKYEGKSIFWWLRSNGKDSSRIAYIHCDSGIFRQVPGIAKAGEIDEYGLPIDYHEAGGIRPALWLKIDNATIDIKGVEINGVVWAPCNVDAPGTFAAKPEYPGMFYQWNRKKGWPATGDVTGWDSSMPTGDKWEKANDPSPAGWRITTLDEIKTLIDTDKVSNEWTTVNGVRGEKFIDKITGNSIFLTAMRYRLNDGTLHRTHVNDGIYWSNKEDERTERGDTRKYIAYSLNLNGNETFYGESKMQGCFIRPVAE